MKTYYIIFIAFLISINSFSKTYYVESTGQDSNTGLTRNEAFNTLDKAFLLLQDNDTVLVGEGTFTIANTLTWGGTLTLIGEGASKTIIQASDEPIMDPSSVYSCSVFHNMKPRNCSGIIPASLIQDVTIQNGAAPIMEAIPLSVGGGVKNFADLTLENCIIKSNVALNGGAIYNDGNLSLINCSIISNHAFNLKGDIFNTSTATYAESNTTFDGNTEDKSDDDFYALIQDFETDLYGQSGTNGNEGGLTANSANFVIADNPNKTGINMSDKVGKFTRLESGNWWAYAWFEFQNTTIDYTPKYLHIMVYKSIVSTVCAQVKNGHNATDGNNTGEIKNDNQDKINEWQDLVFEINTVGEYSYIEIKPDFINQSPASRLDNDVNIFFDNIVINNSATPRNSAEQKLASYPLPIGTYGVNTLEEVLSPEDVIADIEISNLNYTDNLTIDYNYSKGYFRPYAWPDGNLDETKYLEITITPKTGKTVNLQHIDITHKSNTSTLGPQKVGIKRAVDGGEFDSYVWKTIERTQMGTNQYSFEEEASSDEIIIRIYAYESLLGSASQKDFWIIDGIDIYGSITDETISSVVSKNVNQKYHCFLSDNSICVNGIDQVSHIYVWDIQGRLLSHELVSEDTRIPFQKACNYAIIKIENTITSQTFRILR